MSAQQVQVVCDRPKALADIPFHYCPGCTHGIANRIVAEVLDEMNLVGKTIGVASVGCSVFTSDYYACDFVGASHGRAPAMATGIKRVRPDRIVFTYQGDGDLASIGTAEIVHAAARGENITVIFINNAIYGMTGGQMAPTSIPGQKTSSSVHGRNITTQGYPLHTAEMLATLEGASYVVRRSLHDAQHVRQAKKAVRMAFETQVKGLGFSLVELLSTCPTNWAMSPVDAAKWVQDNMLPIFPVGDFKVRKELLER